MLSRAVRKFASQRAASTLVLAEVNSAGELQGTTHSGKFFSNEKLQKFAKKF